MNGERRVIESDAFDSAAADWIKQKIDQVLSESELCHLMLAGGSTPLAVYDRLAAMEEIPWSRIRVYFGDERCVPTNSPENNAYTVLARLFPQGVPEGTLVYPMCAEMEPDAAASAYASILPEKIDILLLGMGEDGHTASIFPGSAALDEEERMVMPVIGHKVPLQRLTITPSVIRKARFLLLMARGEGKADAVRWALGEGRVPAALAVHGDWYLDRAAARSLPHLQSQQGVTA
jgi:6-phosphogluconolactonase